MLKVDYKFLNSSELSGEARAMGWGVGGGLEGSVYRVRTRTVLV